MREHFPAQHARAEGPQRNKDLQSKSLDFPSPAPQDSLTALPPWDQSRFHIHAEIPHPLLSCGEIVPGLAAKAVIQELFHRNLLKPSGLGWCASGVAEKALTAGQESA